MAAIGPGFVYSWGPEHTFFFNAYEEFGAENAPKASVLPRGSQFLAACFTKMRKSAGSLDKAAIAAHLC